jgi:hypothetical protein
MLVAQVTAASLLFPYLLRTRRCAAAVAAAAWPFLLIASVLAAAPLDRAAVAGAYVTAWLFALSLWRAAIRETAARSFGVAVAAVVAIGSAAAWYLQSEYAADGIGGESLSAFGPVTSSLALLTSSTWGGSLWLAPSALAACAISVLLVRRVGRARGWNSIPTSDASASA